MPEQSSLSSRLPVVGGLRFREWWPHKLPPLLAVAYFFLGLSRIEAERGIPVLLLFLTSAVGTAGFGHLLNDLLDRKADAQAGKNNFSSKLSYPQVLLTLLFLLGLSLLPWIFLPAAGLPPLLGVLLLFLLYSIPPVRLKDRAALGLLADALYAHGLPMLITGLVFLGIRDADPLENLLWTWPLVILLVVWKTLQGLAGALCSQLQDRENDVISGTETLAVKLGERRARCVLLGLLQPLHLVSFLLVCGLVSVRLPLFSAAYLVFVVLTAYRVHGRWSRPLTVYRNEYMGYAFLNDFHEQWMPWLALGWLVVQEPGYLVLLPLHLTFVWAVLGRSSNEKAAPNVS